MNSNEILCNLTIKLFDKVHDNVSLLESFFSSQNSFPSITTWNDGI